MEKLNKAFLDFVKTEDCQFCGSQRCYADLETLHTCGPCGAFQRYVTQNCDEETKTEMFALHAKVKY